MGRKLWAIVVCICMLTTIFPVQALAADETPSYVALGDSITTGYGLTSKETEAFPVLVADETGTTLTNLAENGETSASLQTKLQTNESVKTAVAGADVITITIGGNDLMNALYAYLADKDPTLGTPDEIADKFSNGSFTGNLSSLIEYIISFPDSENYTTALQNFESNLKAIISQIKLYNSDAKLVVATQYNPYGHIDTSMISIFFDDIDAALAVFETGVTALNKIINTDINYSVADVYTAFKKANTAEDPLCNASFSLSSINLDFHPNAEGHKMIAGVVADAIGTLPTPEPEPENANITIGGVGLYGDATTLAYAKTDNNGAVTTSGASDTDYNIKWDGTTLTLKDATIIGGKLISDEIGAAAIFCESSLNIALEDSNTVTSLNNKDYSFGICVGTESTDADLSISGNGSLAVTGGNANKKSAGISVPGGSVNILDGTTISATGGDTQSLSMGIDADDVNIYGGTLTAKGGLLEDSYLASSSIFATYAVTVYPPTNKAIAVTAGADETSAKPIMDSPFNTETKITYRVSDAIYVHCEVVEPDTSVKSNIYVGTAGLNGTAEQPAYAITSENGVVTTDSASENNYNIKWDGTTLTLNNATIIGGTTISDDIGTAAIFCNADLVIDLVGTNTVTSLSNASCSYGIYTGAKHRDDPASGNLTIGGSGSLTVTGGEGAESVSVGIRVEAGDLFIASGSVTANGGTASSQSTGIYVYDGNLTVSGGTVIANGSSVTSTDHGRSYGILNFIGDITISGGTVIATGGDVQSTGENGESYGIYAWVLNGNITISGGKVNATGGIANSTLYMESSGIKTYPGALTISGGQVTATGNNTATADTIDKNVTIAPAQNTLIAVTAGENADDATAIDGSPFSSEINIADLVADKKYLHTAVFTEEPQEPPTTDPDEPDDPDDPSTPSTPSKPSTPSEPAGPSTDNSDGWTSIGEEIANADDGDAIVVDMNGTTEVTKEIFESVASKDVDVTFELEGGVSWTVNGTDISPDADLSDLDLGVEMDTDGIPANVINAITGELGTVQLTLAHNGEFAFTMTLTAPLGVENAGYWANLYHYAEDAEQLAFETAAEIDADGNAALPMSHASQYAIVIDDHSHEAEEPTTLPFRDVNEEDWFYDPVRWVFEQGLMTGTSATEFAPNTSTTRAMIVAILHRLEESPSVESAGFTDVADSDWYATAVNWAASEGIVGGFGDSTFQPNSPITREQMASILYRYAEYKGYDVSARADLSAYSDQPSAWAEDVMQWAVAEGLLNGVTDDELQPQGQATRAQVAAILQRFLSE